jgi:lysophospholipase L1-like esterase
MSHLILLGDSIFDNAVYVPGGPSVLDHLHRILPADSRATLLAQDGAIATDVPAQLRRLPADASHLFVSVGGNDALERAGPLLREDAGTVASTLALLADVQSDFRRDYRAMLAAIAHAAPSTPLTLCTIYDAVPGLSPAERAGLALFNDVISREAFHARAALVDLRLACTETSDYAPVSPIEPSASGGGKIARALLRAATDHDPRPDQRQVFV